MQPNEAAEATISTNVYIVYYLVLREGCSRGLTNVRLYCGVKRWSVHLERIGKMKGLSLAPHAPVYLSLVFVVNWLNLYRGHALK
ncbi:hypothetical protein D3C85_1321940 [compost metagenome]